MTDNRLRGRHVIVTGAAMGTGRGIAIRCARAGANVTIVDRDYDNTIETTEEIAALGGQATAVELDITAFEEYDRALDEAIDAFGPVHGLVNNAGVQKQVPALEATFEDWDWYFDVDAKAPFFLSTLVAEHMIGEDLQGGIVNIASSSEELTYPGQAIY